MPTPAHVIGDLHLDPAGGPAVEEFCDWADQARLDHLVILGDLFEAWFGPRTATLPGARRVIDALRALSDRGVRLTVVPGNRDFLLDASFARATGAELRPGGWTSSDGTALVLHGDELCTLDRGYLRLRAILRSSLVRLMARLLPRSVGAAVAGRLRRASVRAVAQKPQEEKQMQVDAADSALLVTPCELLVVGHAHERREVVLPSGRRWAVIDGWGGASDTLELRGPGTYTYLHHGDLIPSTQ